MFWISGMFLNLPENLSEDKAFILNVRVSDFFMLI